MHLKVNPVEVCQHMKIVIRQCWSTSSIYLIKPKFKFQKAIRFFFTYLTNIERMQFQMDLKSEIRKYHYRTNNRRHTKYSPKLVVLTWVILKKKTNTNYYHLQYVFLHPKSNTKWWWKCKQKRAHKLQILHDETANQVLMAWELNKNNFDHWTNRKDMYQH
jgi:hypothetical protein